MKHLLILSIFIFNLYANVVIDVSHNFCNGTTQNIGVEEKWNFSTTDGVNRVIQNIPFSINSPYLHAPDLSLDNFIFNPRTSSPDNYYKITYVGKSSSYVRIGGKQITCAVPQTSCIDSSDDLVGGICVPNTHYNLPLVPDCLDNETLIDNVCELNDYSSENIFFKANTLDSGIDTPDTFCGVGGSASSPSEYSYHFKLPLNIFGVTFNKTSFTSDADGKQISLPFSVKDSRIDAVSIIRSVTPVYGKDEIFVSRLKFTCQQCANGFDVDGSCKEVAEIVGEHLVSARNCSAFDGWKKSNIPDGISNSTAACMLQVPGDCVSYQEFNYDTGVLSYHDYGIKVYNPFTEGDYAAPKTTTKLFCAIDEDEAKKNPTLGVCPDGGALLNGSCDRSCEDVNMVTTKTPTTELDYNSQNLYTCKAQIDCETFEEEALIACGSLANIELLNCSENLNIGTYQCKDDILTPSPDAPKGDIYDNDLPTEEAQIEEAVDDATLTEDAKQAKNDNLKTRTRLMNIHDDMRKGNEALNDQLKVANDHLNFVEANTELTAKSTAKIAGDLEKQNEDAVLTKDAADFTESEVKTQNDSIRQDSEDSANGVLESIDSAIDTVQNGFTFTAPPSTVSNISFNALDKDIVFDPCSSLSQFAFIFSLLIEIILMALSIKLMFFGIAIMKKDS
mgnify:FL=1